jgi:hypothetical protein
MKKCTVCKIEKDFSEFAKHKCTKDGLHHDCRSCAAEYRKRNREKRRLYNIEYNKKNPNVKKEYLEKNKDRISEIKRLSARRCRERNKDEVNRKARERYHSSQEIRDKKKKYREENKQLYRDAANRYSSKNREKMSQKHRDRMASDSIYALKRKIRDAIKNALSKKGYSKTGRTCEILGCEYDFFIQYIESQFYGDMTWKTVTIDHIKPLKTAKTLEDVILLNHYTNLQPLFLEDNSKKKDKLIEKQLRLI